MYSNSNTIDIKAIKVTLKLSDKQKEQLNEHLCLDSCADYKEPQMRAMLLRLVAVQAFELGASLTAQGAKPKVCALLSPTPASTT